MDTIEKKTTVLGRVSLVPRGKYDPKTAYKRLDVMEHEGSSFVALKDFQGIAPTGDDVTTMFLSKRGLTVLGFYGTPEELETEIVDPAAGDAYGVGTGTPYDIYVWDKVHAKWVNNGPFRGKSAYETWLEQGHTGSEGEFLTYMRGEAEEDAKLERKVDKVDGYSLIAADLLSKIIGLPNMDLLENILGGKQNMLVAGNNIRITKVEGSEYLHRIDVNSMEIFKVCPTRPEVGEPDKIYLIPKANVADEVNRYDEFVWVYGKWEYIGTMAVEIDLTNYYAKDQINTIVAEIQLLIDKKADKTDVAAQIKSATSGVPVVDTLTDQDYISVVKMVSGTPSCGKTLLSKLAAYLKADKDFVSSINSGVKSFRVINPFGDSNHFYPVVWIEGGKTADISIHSQGDGGGHPYNQNVLRFTLSACGWSDMPKRFILNEHGMYDSNEVTIHSLYMGIRHGYNALYLRGGLCYYVESNVFLSVCVNGFNNDGDIFGVMDVAGNASVTNATKIWSYA